MFYATKIQSLSNGFAVDVQGRSLQFIGYLPVKAGDTVYTDGKVIFGHVPPKSAPVIFNEPSGIPVLGTSDDAKELRGYFTSNGKFKRYKIAGDDWIVNNKKIYAHDTDNADIIDAEISADGGVYTVEKINQQYLEPDNIQDCIFQISVYGNPMYSISAENLIMNSGVSNYREGTPLTASISPTSAEYFMHDNQIFKDSELTIKKNGETVISFPLSQLCKSIETEISANVNFIVAGAEEPEDHIKSRAILQNFKILPDGNWTALVEAEIWAERGFKYISHTSVKRIHYVGTIDSKSTRVWGNTDFYETITNITITQYPEPIQEELYASTLSRCLCLFKFTSYSKPEFIFKSTITYPLYLRKVITESTSAITQSADITPPGSYCYMSVRCSAQLTGWAGNLSHASTGAGFSPEVDDDGRLYYISYYSYYFDWTGTHDRYSERTYFENVCTLWTTIIYDSRRLADAPDYDNGVEEFNEFYFLVQDGYQAKITNSGDIDTWQLDGIYNGNKQLFDAGGIAGTDAHKWNMSFATLKGGDFLFGIHDDALYKIGSSGTVELVGDDLKNFRLRELKRISKAKK